jgi:hypothetical protein
MAGACADRTQPLYRQALVIRSPPPSALGRDLLPTFIMRGPSSSYNPMDFLRDRYYAPCHEGFHHPQHDLNQSESSGRALRRASLSARLLLLRFGKRPLLHPL